MSNLSTQQHLLDLWKSLPARISGRFTTSSRPRLPVVLDAISSKGKVATSASYHDQADDVRSNLLDAISGQWNRNVYYRARELELSLDSSYKKTILPAIEKRLQTRRGQGKVLDAGCGLGYSSHAIAKLGFAVDAVDISLESIKYAQQQFAGINFYHGDMASFAYNHPNRYGFCVAAMSLHSTPGISSVIGAFYRTLQTNGKLVILIPHPILWARKRKLEDCISSNDRPEQVLQVPFKISGRAFHPSEVTYFHRPIETYIDTLQGSGFVIDELSIAPEEQPDIAVIVSVKP